MRPRTKRIAAGHYTVGVSARHGGYVVTCRFMPHAGKWIAEAQWDRGRYTDFLPTLRKAKHNARAMIEDAKREETRRALAVFAEIERRVG